MSSQRAPSQRGAYAMLTSESTKPFYLIASLGASQDIGDARTDACAAPNSKWRVLLRHQKRGALHCRC